jgi:hypothetical protein
VGDCDKTGTCTGECKTEAPAPIPFTRAGEIKLDGSFNKQATLDKAMRALADLLTGAAQAYAMIAEAQADTPKTTDAEFNKQASARFEADRFGNLTNGFAHGLCFLAGCNNGSLTTNSDEPGKIVIRITLDNGPAEDPNQTELPLAH